MGSVIYLLNYSGLTNTRKLIVELPWQLHRSEQSVLVNGKHPQFQPQNFSLTSFPCLFQALERCANKENAEEPTKRQLSFSTYVVITSAVCLIFFLTLIVIREYRRLKRQNNVVAINNSWDIKLLCKIVRVMKNTLLFIGRRERFYVRRWFNSHRTGLEHQHGRLFSHRFNLVPRVLSLASRKSSGWWLATWLPKYEPEIRKGKKSNK